MYTIIMNQDKSLTTSVYATLYQREKLVDKIQFLIPTKYENVSLSECTTILKYVDQGNVAHAEELVKDENVYKDNFIRFVMPVDTNLTRFAGNIKAHLSFIKMNTENSLQEEVLHSGEVTIKILPLDDYFTFCSDESLDVIDKKMAELIANQNALKIIAETYDEDKADNICLDQEKESIYLTSNDRPVGNPISLNMLGDSLAEKTEDGLISVITEDEIEIAAANHEDKSIKYKLLLDQGKNVLYVLAGEKIISTISISNDEGVKQDGVYEEVII